MTSFRVFRFKLADLRPESTPVVHLAFARWVYVPELPDRRNVLRLTDCFAENAQTLSIGDDLAAGRAYNNSTVAATTPGVYPNSGVLFFSAVFAKRASQKAKVEFRSEAVKL